MTDGIFESISQGIGREKTQENRRIQEIADELRRRCCIYEKKYGDCCKYGDIFVIDAEIELL
jgi:hypothetical protein